jgi:hypothetical protein
VVDVANIYGDRVTHLLVLYLKNDLIDAIRTKRVRMDEVRQNHAFILLYH